MYAAVAFRQIMQSNLNNAGMVKWSWKEKLLCKLFLATKKTHLCQQLTTPEESEINVLEHMEDNAINSLTQKSHRLNVNMTSICKYLLIP